ncbi:protoporphyrinogen oxidase [Listeria floridensis FSL S10-1187]|uniref:Coproporphyrinogen III oxidase n=1 Tax=Listeria floridensis FSL S10-1187 TaxID=1265817 RepID=A0ABN0RE34_9LIST|nr:protoporphyrinogen oxidase [Listeria floridensis]EUJ30761.1 protoporphyrinogen oxidase [Listeria floridensis FSL S10-1187]
MKRILIIGGGLSGLAAAYTLHKRAANDIQFDLYESEADFTGKFNTIKRDGFLIEKGPDSFLARKTAGIDLIAELGLTDQLVANATGRSYIYNNGGLFPIPEGSVMGIPTDEQALLASKLISEAGKERAVLEKTLPYHAYKNDVSLGEFFEARFGLELVKGLIEPLLSGIYAGDIYKMSLRATFPQFEKAAEQAGSLMQGLAIPSQVNMQTTGTKNTIGAFRTLQNGLSEFPKAIAAALPLERLHAGKRAMTIQKHGFTYQVKFADGTTEEADAVLIAAAHDTAVQLLDKGTAAPFRDRPLSTLATVSLAYEDAERANLPEGTGYLVARTKNYRTTACTWVHKKWPHMVPEGKMLLRGFVGKAGENWIEQKSDEEITEIVLKDYKEMMGLSETPLFAEVSRMPNAMPQYDVGHLERLQVFRANLHADYPRVQAVGMSYEGVGIPDCIRTARVAAEKLISEVRALD